MFTLRNVAINGYVISLLWSNSLESGNTGYDEIYLSSSQMQLSGITSIDKLELFIDVYDKKNWFSDYFVNDKFTIYPTGLSENEIEYPNRPISEKDRILVENDDLSIIVIDWCEDSNYGYTLLTYFENKTNKFLVFYWSDVVINGYNIGTTYLNFLYPGTKEVTTIELSSSDLQKAGIKSIDKIKLYFIVSYYNDWLSEYLVNEKFTIYPTGLSDDKVNYPDWPKSIDEDVVLDNTRVSFIIYDSYMDSILGYVLEVYVENKSNDKKLIIEWKHVKINGYEINPSWNMLITPKTRGLSTITFSLDDLNENNIITINSIEFFIKISNYDWYSEYSFKEKYTFLPNNK